LTHIQADDIQDQFMVSIEEAISSESLKRKLTIRTPDFVIVHQSLITDITLLPKDHFAILASEPDEAIFLTARQHGLRAYLSDDPSEYLLHEILYLAPERFLIDPGFIDWFMCLVANNGHHIAIQKSLTPREQEIVALLDQGISPEEIAEKLCIAVGTVRRHMANVSAKRK
jgi:DNA-binding NarL/FixJ family response regulator